MKVSVSNCFSYFYCLFSEYAVSVVIVPRVYITVMLYTFHRKVGNSADTIVCSTSAAIMHYQAIIPEHV
jgi:hypothetical protein